MTNGIFFLGIAFAIATIAAIVLFVRDSIRESVDRMEQIIGDYPYTGDKK